MFIEIKRVKFASTVYIYPLFHTDEVREDTKRIKSIRGGAVGVTIRTDVNTDTFVPWSNVEFVLESTSLVP